MHLKLWIIVALSITGVLVRPFRWPEAVWAIAGAVLIVVCDLLPMGQSLQAVGKGADVYLFLIGMMLLAETARREGLFDWVAVLAVNAARGSTRRLFLLIYAVGVVVTVFLSNDATAVVLTPAVFAAARKAKTEPVPLLFVCAFVANAASFVLPISNPANIVLYGEHTPPLLQWLDRFALSSLLAIVATFLGLWITQRHALLAPCAIEVEAVPLQPGARIALIGLGLTAMVLMTVSALDMKLGLPTAVLGIFTAVVVMLRESRSPLNLVKGISWTVLPLVAGLFVIVEAVDRIGIAAELGRWLGTSASEWKTAALSAGVIAVGSNLVNNLPAGLVASAAVENGHLRQRIVDALLIGVDLGPNLSITGSLATLLWLAAIRREGENVGFWSFLRVGLVVMPPALVVTIAARLL